MASLLRDPVIRRIPWRDLATLGPNRALARPSLALAFPAARLARRPLRAGFILLGSAYFFLAGFRLVHDEFHANIGLPRPANHAVLLIMSGLLLGSMHAVRLTHLEHHRDCLGPQDVEGATARRSGLGALGQGFAFPVALHRQRGISRARGTDDGSSWSSPSRLFSSRWRWPASSRASPATWR
jgi:hypothetical protein